MRSRGLLDVFGFVASFLRRLASTTVVDSRFREALERFAVEAVNVEQAIDERFTKAASSAQALAHGSENAKYCQEWGGTPTPGGYKLWRALRSGVNEADLDDPFTSYEHFAGLRRVRQGFKDSEAAKRRVGYRGKGRHTADEEEDGDACKKAFFIKCGLTQGVFNVVCPHVITLGFRCLFRAESVGEALSIILAWFPKLAKVVFYDVVCKLDKIALRRVRPIFRAHNVRFILDRPHSVTHSCSPVYMLDVNLGATAGVATQAAEVSHAIAAINRTSLAYMAPASYMVHKMVQVALMNMRKLHRLSQENETAEDDHITLSAFYHSHLSSACKRCADCRCQSSQKDGGPLDAGPASMGDVAGVPAVAVGATAAAKSPPAVHATVSPFVVGDIGEMADERPRHTAGLPPNEASVEAAPVSSSVIGPVELRKLSADALLGDSADVPLDDSSAPVGRGDGSRVINGGRVLALEDQVDAMSVGRPQRLGVKASDKCFETLSSAALVADQVTLIAAPTAVDPLSPCVPPNNKARIQLTSSDFRALCAREWLTDDLINSFLVLINHRDSLSMPLCRSAALVAGPVRTNARVSATPRTFMFNTYFYLSLLAQKGLYDYAGVKNWSRKCSLRIHVVKLVLVPVLIVLSHWVLVAVNVRAQLFMFYDPYLSINDIGIIITLRRWVEAEVKEQMGTAVAGDWAVDNWPLISAAHLPRQSGSCSCDVLALVVADCSALGAAATFSQEDLPVLRKRLALTFYVDDLTDKASAGKLCGVDQLRL